MSDSSSKPLRIAAGEQLGRLQGAIAEIEADAPPERSARGKILRSLRQKRDELVRDFGFDPPS
jgi:hypothetical protein